MLRIESVQWLNATRGVTIQAPAPTLAETIMQTACNLSVLAVAGLSLLAGIATARAQEPIRIGVLEPMTGPATKNGIENFTAMQIARDLINERGGINGRKVELLLADIPTPTAAVSETERLITKEGVKITLGSGVSQLAIPVSQTAPPGAGLFFFVRPLGALPGGPSAYLKRHPHRRHPKLSVAAARKVARGYAGKVAGGGNPAADLQAERARRVDADYAGVAAAARPVLEPEGFAAGGQDAHKATLRVLLAEGGPYECELARRRVVNIKPALSSLRRGLARLMSA